LALATLTVFLLAAPATAQTYPPLTGRVVDDAHLLSPDQAAQLTLKLETLERSTTRQLVVATVPDLQGREIEEFANGLVRRITACCCLSPSPSTRCGSRLVMASKAS
jgi:uncharacterized protein